MLGDQRLAAVGADQILRADGDVLAGQPVAAGGGDAVGVLDMRQIFGRHARLRAARAGRLEQHRLHEGLRQVVHQARRGQLVLGARQRVLAPACFMRPSLLAGERGAEDVLAHQVLLGGVEIGLGLDLLAEVAQHLHGALVGDVGARRVGQPAIAVDHHVLDAVGRQQRRRGRARRTGADDQYVGGDVGHAGLLLKSSCVERPPAMRRRTGNSWMPVRSANRPHRPARREQHDGDADQAEQQQIPGAVVGEQVLQREENDHADDRPLDGADAADHDDEDDVGGPVDDREGGVRRDARLLHDRSARRRGR